MLGWHLRTAKNVSKDRDAKKGENAPVQASLQGTVSRTPGRTLLGSVSSNGSTLGPHERDPQSCGSPQQGRSASDSKRPSSSIIVGAALGGRGSAVKMASVLVDARLGQVAQGLEEQTDLERDWQKALPNLWVRGEVRLGRSAKRRESVRVVLAGWAGRRIPAARCWLEGGGGRSGSRVEAPNWGTTGRGTRAERNGDAAAG